MGDLIFVIDSLELVLNLENVYIMVFGMLELNGIDGDYLWVK